jgi:FkbM family methyltransferase
VLVPRAHPWCEALSPQRYASFGLRARKLWSLIATRDVYGIRHRIPPSIEHAHLRRLGLAFVVDVGANRGQFAKVILSECPDAVVVCIEPVPSAARCLDELKSSHRLHVHMCAVGADHDTATFYVTEDDDSSSLLPVGRTQHDLYGTSTESEVQVRVERLDDLVAVDDLAHPSLLKIDVQGTELDVLRGAGDLLRSLDYIYVECSFVELYEGQALAPEVLAFARGAGFDLAGVYNPNFAAETGACVQADFLLERVRPPAS